MSDSWMSITKWQPIVGIWTIGQDGKIEFRGPQGQLKEYVTPTGEAHGICVSDVTLDEGSVCVDVCQDPANEGWTDARLLLGFRSTKKPYLVVGLGGYGFAFTASLYNPDQGWSAFAISGSQDNLVVGEQYKLRVRLVGQQISLFVNDVRVIHETMRQPAPIGQLGLFTWGSNPVTFTNVKHQPVRSKVFVVMQFSEPYYNLYNEVIKPVCNEFGLEALHAGEVFGPGIILQDIQAQISEATIVVAEITPANQNVFYELGYAHALGKATILLAEKGKSLPFDTASYRTLFYENSIGGKVEVEEALRKHLRAILEK